MLAGYPRRRGLISWRAARAAAEAALARMGGGVDAGRARRRPAGGRKIDRGDRPRHRRSSASCSCSTSRPRRCRRPTSRACSACSAACAQSGIGIVYVTHRLDEVFRIADRVTVLRDGRRVTTDAVAETTPAALVHSIVGRSLSDLFVKPSPSTAEIVLSVDELMTADVGPVSFTVSAGEVLGLVGLRGAGHRRGRAGDIRRHEDRVRLGVAEGRAAPGACAARRDPPADRVRIQQAGRGEPRAAA